MLHLLISVPMLTALFWLVWFALSYRESDSAKRMMTWFFCASFILYSMHFIYFSGVQSKVAETVYAVANLLVYPLFWFYLLKLAGKDISLQLLWLLPAFMVAIAYPVFYVLEMDTAHKVTYITARCCFTLQVAYTAFFGTRLIIQFRRTLDDQFSDDRSYSLRPLFWLILLFATISLLAMLNNLIGREWFAGKNVVAAPALLMSLLLYLLGYVTSHLKLTNVSVDSNQPTQYYTDETDKPAGFPRLRAEELQALMQEKKPYLNPNLTLGELAAMLHTNRTYLSCFLRDELQVNFATYINMYRVEEAKKILSNNSHLSQKAALQDAIIHSGFSSESSFYRIFKQLTGMTPYEWKNTIPVEHKS